MLVEIGVEGDEHAERRCSVFLQGFQGEKMMAEELVCQYKVVESEECCDFQTRSKTVSTSLSNYDEVHTARGTAHAVDLLSMLAPQVLLQLKRLSRRTIEFR